jgi:hypothetical protein
MSMMGRLLEQGPTNESPCIASFMYLHPRRANVGGVAEIREPHILNMKVVKCLRTRSKLVISTQRAQLPLPYKLLY